MPGVCLGGGGEGGGGEVEASISLIHYLKCLIVAYMCMYQSMDQQDLYSSDIHLPPAGDVQT